MAVTTPTRLDVLEAVQDRVLWLATSIVHHANKVRETRSGVKVGGHQASSASMVSLMTALYFDHLRAEDRVSVKPHAAPVLHAIEYLLGKLDRAYLETLREFGGLQSYPSRTKDPDAPDFSTGSVGIGATAPVWSAIAHRYVASHFEVAPAGRAISLLGDAELDEGACWEAIVDPMVGRLGEVLWVVDLNRQSLDRVVPDVAASRLIGMFETAGWQTLTMKYGRRLSALFMAPGGEALRRRIDEMSNEEYQWLLRAPATTLRLQLPTGPGRRELTALLTDVDDDDLVRSFRDLGGHDVGLLLDGFAAAAKVTDRPTVIFAYTIKAWRLPTEGHPGNHSALLTTEQWMELAADVGADHRDPWRLFDENTAEAELCARAASRLERRAPARAEAAATPTDLQQREKGGLASTQQSFGRCLWDLTSAAPHVARRVVTVSPDVASSTGLGGWINKVGVWHLADRRNWFRDDSESLVKWSETNHGQHIELGIAEVNLVGLLGELGLTWTRDGEPLLPIGTLYDPFVARALEPWSFGIYGGGQSILVGTPSGVSLAPEGGAHQSVITPSIGLEQPRCIAWEPAFAQDLEWTLLHALSLLGREGGSSSYFRLSTRPIDQALADVPTDETARELRRRAALAGGYRIRTSSAAPDVTLVGVGAVMPEVLAAATMLEKEDLHTDVVCLTSPDLVFRAQQAVQRLPDHRGGLLDALFPADRASPLVTVIDGHPHTLSFLSSIRCQPIVTLGVSDFGQSGDVDDLYRVFGIDVDTICGAAFDLEEATSASDAGCWGGG